MREFDTPILRTAELMEREAGRFADESRRRSV